MADSLHQVHILASDKIVYNAISLQSGIESWWTDHCQMAAKEGEISTFWFDNKRSVFTMRTQKLLPNRRIFWVCEQGPEEWVGTELWWEIQPNEDGSCTLDFKHMNWAKDTGLFPLCNSTWGTLMLQLKIYCETGEQQPWFQQTA
jgi:uncharacterized protein YndB with AHSA1/START domain